MAVRIPACYDPAEQAERIAVEQDLYMDSLPECSICGCPIHPGESISRIRYRREELAFCRGCMLELAESAELYIREEDLL